MIGISLAVDPVEMNVTGTVGQIAEERLRVVCLSQWQGG
jgi:hypothetical protein